MVWPIHVPRKGVPSSPTGAAVGAGVDTGAEPSPSRVKMIFAPSSSMQRVPSAWRTACVPSIRATSPLTVQVPVSSSSPSNSAAVPSSLRVSCMTMPKSSRLNVEPSISMVWPIHVPRKGVPSGPTGTAGAGVAVGSGVGMGSLLTAASSASTLGIREASVMHFSREKASV